MVAFGVLFLLKVTLGASADLLIMFTFTKLLDDAVPASWVIDLNSVRLPAIVLRYSPPDLLVLALRSVAFG